MYRHGDLLILPVEALPEGAQAREGNILAYGEATGHAHAVRGTTVSLWDAEKSTYFTVGPEGAELTHQEHGAIPLPEGAYQVIRQREYQPDEVRYVAD